MGYDYQNYIDELCSRLESEATDSLTNSNLSLLTSHNFSSNLNGTEHDYLKEICSSDNNDSMFPPNIVRLLRYRLHGLCGLIVCILGFIGNAMSISVLKEKSLSPSSPQGSTSSTSLYLVALAVSDCMLLVFGSFLCLYDILDETFPNSIEVTNYKNYTSTFVITLVTTFQTISVWLTVAFTVDRYIMICHPFGGVKYCTRRRALAVIICLYIFAVIYNIPSLFEHKTFSSKKVIDGREVLYVKRKLTELGRSSLYRDIYYIGMYLVFNIVLPCLILGALNLRLLITVKESKSTERRLSLGMTPLQHRNDTTIMLVAVVVVFFILQVPAMISRIIWNFQGPEITNPDPKYNFLRMIPEISNFLVYLNSAVNILLYYGFSHNFRRKFISKFCRRPCERTSKLLAKELRRRLSCRSIDDTVSSWYGPCSKQDTEKQVGENAVTGSESLMEFSTTLDRTKYGNHNHNPIPCSKSVSAGDMSTRLSHTIQCNSNGNGAYQPCRQNDGEIYSL